MSSLGRCAVAVATALLVAGCGKGAAISTQPTDRAAYGDGAVRLNVDLEAHTTRLPGWKRSVKLRPGDRLSMRLFIRNEDASASGDVRVALRLPRSLVVDPSSVTERSVPEVEALGDAVADPEALTGRGLQLAPFQPGTFTTIQLTATERGTRGVLAVMNIGTGRPEDLATVTASAHVTTLGTDATSRLSVRLSG